MDLHENVSVTGMSLIDQLTIKEILVSRTYVDLCKALSDIIKMTKYFDRQFEYSPSTNV